MSIIWFNMKQIVWKRNNMGGKSAYVGSIRIGYYWFNGVDSKNGKYKTTSLLPQSTLASAYAQDDVEAEQMIIKTFETFIANISK